MHGNPLRKLTELRVLIEELKGISTYFHTSGVRTRERKTIAEKYKLPIRRYPVHFQIRFTEFLFELINAHLSSWNATTLYFRGQSKEHEEDGYFKLMTNKFKLQLMAFVADVLAVFKRYQKLIQDDGITILEVESRTKTVRTQIRSLSTKPLSGGWEEALLSALSEDGDSLKGIKLQDARKRRVPHSLVTVTKELGAIKNEIICSLDEFLSQRFDIDQKLVGILRHFVGLQSDCDIKEVHNTICSDLDLMELTLEFEELARSENVNHIQELKLPQLVQYLFTSKDIYLNMITALCRVLAAKPHSCDVERLISACNLLKTSMRNRTDIKTQNLYLCVHFNMETLEEWDSRPSIIRWLNQKEHRKKTVEKAKSQRWFKGVFKEAKQARDESDDEEDEVKNAVNEQSKEGKNKCKKF